MQQVTDVAPQHAPVPAPAPASAPKGASALRGMDFEAGSAALAPVQLKVAPNAAGQLSDAQVRSAVAYNRARPISHAQWQHIQRTVGSAADGQVGPNTVRAVARWQAGRGLDADGKVGPATLAQVQAGAGGGAGAATSTLTPSQITAAVRYNQGRGFAREAVRQIQERVGSDADGAFGPNTVRAIARWQAGHGLEVDGKVGPTTAARLGVQAGGGQQAPVGGSNSAKLGYAKKRAVAIGLTITSTTGGKHAPNSYHYSGRAIDVAGSGAKMAQFYREMHTMAPTELFYDPLGGVKHGQDIGAIGGHSDHVHIAF